MEGSNGFVLVWIGSIRYDVKTWVWIVFDIDDVGFEIFCTGFSNSGADTWDVWDSYQSKKWICCFIFLKKS